eukprot:2557553-Prymnesium_polylepis.2
MHASCWKCTRSARRRWSSDGVATPLAAASRRPTRCRRWSPSGSARGTRRPRTTRYRATPPRTRPRPSGRWGGGARSSGRARARSLTSGSRARLSGTKPTAAFSSITTTANPIGR